MSRFSVFTTWTVVRCEEKNCLRNQMEIYQCLRDVLSKKHSRNKQPNGLSVCDKFRRPSKPNKNVLVGVYLTVSQCYFAVLIKFLNTREGEKSVGKRSKFGFAIWTLGWVMTLCSISFPLLRIMFSNRFHPANIVFTSNSHYTRVSKTKSIYFVAHSAREMERRILHSPGLIWTIYFYCLVLFFH